MYTMKEIRDVQGYIVKLYKNPQLVKNMCK